MASKTILIWLLSFVIMISAAIYQRRTGPTYEVRGSTEFAGETIAYKLYRTHEGDTDMPVSIPVTSATITGVVEWKRNKVDEPWQPIPMELIDGRLVAYLPNQPPAGKLEYTVTLTAGEESVVLSNKGRAVVTRFKGVVQIWILLPHILAMFIGMLVSTRAGLEAFLKRDNLKILTIWSFGLIFFGGMVLGPVVQYMAFGDFWTGVPFGWDLTDNKTLIMVIAWGWALWAVLKDKPARVAAMVASVVTIIVYLIPHSMLGSEIDYTAEGDRVEF